MGILDKHRKQPAYQQHGLPCFIKRDGGHVITVSVYHAAVPSKQEDKRAQQEKARELDGADEYVPRGRTHTQHPPYNRYNLQEKHLKERIQSLEVNFNAKKLPMQPVVDKFDSGLSGMQPMKMIASGHRKRGEAL